MLLSGVTGKWKGYTPLDIMERLHPAGGLEEFKDLLDMSTAIDGCPAAESPGPTTAAPQNAHATIVPNKKLSVAVKGKDRPPAGTELECIPELIELVLMHIPSCQQIVRLRKASQALSQLHWRVLWWLSYRGQRERVQQWSKLARGRGGISWLRSQ
jgi:hypothetical protein